MSTFLISINPPYTTQIFKKEKRFEFRKKIIGDMRPNDVMYIYETKNKKGSGMVIGRVIIEEIIGPIVVSVTGDVENLDPAMVDHIVKKAQDDLYQLRGEEELNALSDEDYRKTVEEYLDELGYNGLWNYAIRIGEVYQFKKPLELSSFKGKNGVITHPPMNMMRIDDV